MGIEENLESIRKMKGESVEANLKRMEAEDTVRIKIPSKERIKQKERAQTIDLNIVRRIEAATWWDEFFEAVASIPFIEGEDGKQYTGQSVVALMTAALNQKVKGDETGVIYVPPRAYGIWDKWFKLIAIQEENRKKRVN